MIHLEIVGSSASPRADLISRLGLVDSRNGRIGSPSSIYPPSTPPSRRDARIIRIPSSRLKKTPTPTTSRRALKRSTAQQDSAPLPEPADEDLPPDYIASVNNAIASYNTTPTSSGRSSPTSMDTQSTLSISQGGWTTGNTTERSSLDSSCYSMDEFERQAASTVNQHFEEFESMLFEGPRETVSSVYRECQEWVTQFPHIRVLGKQVMAPKDTGFHFVSPTNTSNSTTPRPSTSGTLDLNLSEHDLSFASDTQGLTLSGRKVKATKAPLEVTSMLTARSHRLDTGSDSHVSSDYDFLHEEIFAQDGVYEDIIAVDYKNIYEDNMEHKKQITPRRRRVGYPPITPNACVKDSVSSGAFDRLWCEIMSWTQPLIRRYAAELEAKKQAGDLGHVMIPAPPYRASSFVLPMRSPHGMDGQVSFDGMLNVSRMALRNRNPLGMSSGDVGDSSVLGMTAQALAPVQRGNNSSTNRPATVNPHRWRQSQGRRLDPLPEPSKVQNADEGRSHQPSPQNALRVKQIVPTGPHRLSSPPNPLAGRLPPLESSGVPAHRKTGHRASSAIDNKEGRHLGGRDRSNNAVEVSRPSTTQAFRSDTPFSMSRRSSTPLGQNIPSRQLYLMSGHKALGITGSGLHPSADPTPNILEDQEGPTREDIHHNQWIPSAPSYTTSFLKRIRMRSLRN
ncbi:protein FAM149B1-like isoform X2 [Babylonia areolata]|uniref:protein FAM149B1-like isoform X2 n=1 Tax=Babylonia areolata TaxID=304850 RepID=UPI003FD3A3BA